MHHPNPSILYPQPPRSPAIRTVRSQRTNPIIVLILIQYRRIPQHRHESIQLLLVGRGIVIARTAAEIPHVAAVDMPRMVVEAADDPVWLIQEDDFDHLADSGGVDVEVWVPASVFVHRGLVVWDGGLAVEVDVHEVWNAYVRAQGVVACLPKVLVGLGPRIQL